MSMTAEQTKAASDLIVAHWRAGTRMTALPDHLRPATRAAGYAIQAHLEERGELFGWKIAATSEAGQKHIGVDGPLAGRILAEHVYQPGATLPWANNFMNVAEAEFAFRMARDLPPRATPYTVAEVLDAVASLHPAIEVPDTRFTDFSSVGGPGLIADNACGHDFVLGTACKADWRALDLAAYRVIGTVTGKVEREGIGANVLGDPRIALAWLANELSAHAMTLRAGQVVTTGTCLVPLEIVRGDTVRVDFGQLGAVTAVFSR